MPLIPLNETPSFIPERYVKTDEELEAQRKQSFTGGRVDPDGGLWETTKAAFRMDNSLASFAYNRTTQQFDADESYSPFADEEELKGFDPMLFVESRSREETEYIKNQIKLEEEDRKFIDSQGVTGMVASMAAGVLDPITIVSAFVPAAGIVRGGSALLSGAKVAAGAAVGSGVTEYALHQTQQTRTIQESVLNVSADMLLSGVLGSALQVFKGVGEVQAVKQKSKDYLTDKGEFRDIGAAQTKATTLEDETLLYAKVVKAAGFFSPQVSMMQSPSLVARKVAQSLAENNLMFNKTLQGMESQQAVETAIKSYHGLLWRVNQDVDIMYTAYKQRVDADIAKGNPPEEILKMTPSKERFAAFAGFRQKAMSRKKFYESVTKAMRDGDEHMIPEVQAAAKQLRPIYEETGKKAVELGLIPEEALKVKTAKSYVNRAYNFAKIRKDRAEFVQILKGHFAKQDLEAFVHRQEQLDIVRATGVTDDEILANFDKFGDLIGERLSDEQIEEIANAVTDKILGAPNGIVDEYNILPEGIISKAGVLKERTLNIEDVEIEDFLENDITYVMNRYIKQIAPDIELTRAYGSKDMGQVIDKINEEYAQLKIGVEPIEAEKLEKLRKNDIKNLELMRDRLLGTYGAPKDPTSAVFRASRVMRQINFLSMLGGMAISAIPDLSRVVMQHGLKNAAVGIRDFARVKVAKTLLNRNDSVGKALKEELNEMGVAIDYVLSTRAQSFSDITADNMGLTGFERGMDRMSNMFGNATLMNQWNDTMKLWGGLVIQSRIMKAAQKVVNGEKLSKKTKIAMARTGLNEEMLQLIGEQFNKHGEKDGGLFLSRSHLWDNEVFPDGTTLSQRYQNAVLGDVENVIVTPSVGDKPAWFDGNEAQKHLTQFKSFFFATSSKMAGNLQQNDAALYMGLSLSIGLGALTSNIKEILRGNEPDYSWNNQLKEGLDFSGVLGWIAEPIALSDKWSGGRFGLGGLLGVDSGNTRYKSRGDFGALLGASVSTGENLYKIGQGIMGEEWTSQNSRAVRKLIPMQNLFYLRTIINEAESGVNELAGVK